MVDLVLHGGPVFTPGAVTGADARRTRRLS